MAVLVFIEKEENEVRKASLEAVTYARHIAEKTGQEVTGIFPGTLDEEQLMPLGAAGCHRVIQLTGNMLDQPMINNYAEALTGMIMEADPEYIILAQSSLADPVAAIAGIRTGASVVTNVTSLPDFSPGCTLERSIYTGKAFETVQLSGKRKIISIRKNACGVGEYDQKPEVVSKEFSLKDDAADVRLTGTDKMSGDILLSEASIVVSGGRGLKGPEKWGVIEELADELGAAKGCSKPVSDAGWRPHHEHVGQTGIKVSPDLYVAVGISGAIQHLAGVSSSKYILIINNDPEAPFFKAADYGVVGDAFEVIPSLIESLRKLK